MKRALDPAAIAINTALAVAAVFALFPLLWMVSVSFMQPGAASSYPAPVLLRRGALARGEETRFIHGVVSDTKIPGLRPTCSLALLGQVRRARRSNPRRRFTVQFPHPHAHSCSGLNHPSPFSSTRSASAGPQVPLSY